MRSKRIVDIQTSHPRGGSLNRIVLGNSKDLVVIQKIEGFEPDGILVISLPAIP